MSVVLTRLSFNDLFDAVRSQHGNMLLYSLALWCWTRLGLGSSDAWVRALSGVISIASVPLFMAVAPRLIPRRAVPLAVGLYILHPFLLRYAQEARGYSLMLMVALLVVWRWLCYLEQGGRWRWFAWVGAGGLLGYTHYYLFTLIGTMVLGSLLFARALGGRRHMHLMAGIAGIVTLNVPAILLAVSQTGSGGLDWIREGSSMWLRALAAVADVTGNRSVVLALAVIVAGCAGIVLGGKMYSDEQEKARLGLLLTWLGVPAASALVAWPAQPLLVGRYFIFLLPPLLLLAAMGPSSLEGLGKRRVLSIGLILCAGVGVVMWKQRPPEEDWRSATAFVLEESQPGDGVVAVPWFVRAPVEVYVGRDARSTQLVPLYPEAGWGRYVAGRAPEILEPSLLAKEVGVRGVSRVWVFVRTGAVSGRAVAEQKGVRGALGDRAEVVRSFRGVRVERYGIRSVSGVADHDSPG